MSLHSNDASNSGAAITFDTAGPQSGDLPEALVAKLIDAVADNAGRSTGVAVPVTRAACTFATDNVVTCAGHGLSNLQPVRFEGSGVTWPTRGTDGYHSTTSIQPGRIYYVRDATTGAFKIADVSGGAEIDLTSAGTGTFYAVLGAHVSLNVTSNKGAITAQTPDNTTSGGNARGEYALDLQRVRSDANQVAEPLGSLILTGFGNRIRTHSSVTGTFYGSSGGILTGFNNLLYCNGRGSGIIGYSNSVTGAGSSTVFVAGNSNAVMAGSGGSMVCLGDQHVGGGQQSTWVGGFHSLINYICTTDLGASGAQIGAQGGGTLINFGGGLNITVMGGGTHGWVQGSINYVSHANKNKGVILLTQQYSTTTAAGSAVATGATATVEMLPMGYHSGGNLKKFAVFPNMLITVEFAATIVLVNASSPEYGLIRKRATYFTGTSANGVPTLVGSVATIETSGSNAGALPANWNCVITPEAGTLTWDLTVENHAGSSRNIHALAEVKASWVKTDANT